MTGSKSHIKISDAWLDDLERQSRTRAYLPYTESQNLIAHVRALKHEREGLIAELEAFERGLPAPQVPSEATRREAWAKLGWIV